VLADFKHARDGIDWSAFARVSGNRIYPACWIACWRVGSEIALEKLRI